MDRDDKDLSKAFGSRASSSALSTPEDSGHMNESMKGQAFLKSREKESVCVVLDEERRPDQTKCKVIIEASGATTICKSFKNSETKKNCSNNSYLVNNQTPKKHPRKGDNPVRVPCDESLDTRSSVCTWICKNSACKAVLNADDTFCKRCSCCICHLFDDNKDPSLWLVCSSEKGDDQDCCGLSCHVECAFQHQRIAVIDLGESMQIDRSYCCASCGKVSGILGCWKKQLNIAKDARRVDVLCYRIFLSYRLLEGTSSFKELHNIIEDAKAKLEEEVGPVNGVSSKMARGIVSRLSVAGEVQKLCSLAVEKAEELLSCTSFSVPKNKDSLPAACKFQFEEITSTTCVIVLRGTCASSESIKGYKLWYWKSREQQHMKEPVIFAQDQRRISITNLQPCTEYIFRVISFSEDCDLGHSESKCFTKSVEIIHKETIITTTTAEERTEGCSSGSKRPSRPPPTGSTSGFKVRNLGRILRRAWAEEEACFEGYCCDDVEESYGLDGGGGSTTMPRPEPIVAVKSEPAVSRRLDLNVVLVPDLNVDATPPTESSPDEENWCSGGLGKNPGLACSDGGSGGDSLTCVGRPGMDVPTVESRPDTRKRDAVRDETCEGGDSTLITASAGKACFPGASGPLDENYEYCVKVVRWLECLGHVEKDFRMKFLTWFSLRSTQQERRVVITFIRTLIEEPSSLAAQLLDSFLEIVTCKRPRYGFCTKLWH